MVRKRSLYALMKHSFFNLSDNVTIKGTVVTLGTDQYLPVDEKSSLPLGTVEKHPLINAGEAFILDETEPDLDLCFVMNTQAQAIPLDTRGRELKKLINAFHPESGTHLEVFSTEPAFQFYTGKYLDVPASTSGPAFPARAGFCVEPSRYIDAINKPEWRGMVVIGKDQTYGARNVYKAWIE